MTDAALSVERRRRARSKVEGLGRMGDEGLIQWFKRFLCCMGKMPGLNSELVIEEGTTHEYMCRNADPQTKFLVPKEKRLSRAFRSAMERRTMCDNLTAPITSSDQRRQRKEGYV
ncbi:hypothetical protein QN277_010368 [Acacia crassicarpa]|uniref:Uncharacterized protein n=1 Tax=Acacia crassicarpa TaxID=499986 RepID=A0AAE1JIC8_9FABA|nr:hypothetical protein QN277_010368 [Acacia crassicarpa]